LPTTSWRAALRALSLPDAANFNLNVHALQGASAPIGPLSGVGVIITRPARQSAGITRQLAALGAWPIVFPAISILPPANRASLDSAHAALDQYDIAIFVSANAVEYGVPAPEAWPARLRALAPGPGTAAALAATGIENVTIPATTFDSDGLLALPDLHGVAGKRIVIFRGEGGRGELGEVLRARGAKVDYAECYRRAMPATGAAGLSEALREGRAHALTLTSSEGIDNLCALLEAEDARRLRQLPTFAPHPRIAQHARELGFDTVETGAADAGLVNGLLEWFRQHPLP
jgi:uroporphyrinogen-III synthase